MSDETCVLCGSGSPEGGQVCPRCAEGVDWRELKSHQDTNDFLRDHGDESDKGIKHEYTVAIVIRTWHKDRGKRGGGRITDYRYRGLGYKLNFCPECGRDLRRRRK